MNINEIARLAGVSRATVSRYLNKGYVSEEKKEIIRKVIEETGYQPSAQAQTLRTKKTSLVGVILPKINSDTISREVAGISDVLTARGYQLILANTNNNLDEELKYLSLFKRKHKQMLKDIRILGDTTAAEVYLNKGEVVFSTRYYPQDRKQALKINAQQIKGNLYQLDSMKFTK